MESMRYRHFTCHCLVGKLILSQRRESDVKGPMRVEDGPKRELRKSKLGKQQLGATVCFLPRWTIRVPRRAGFGSADWNSCDLGKGGLS